MRCKAIENDKVKLIYHGDMWGLDKEKLISSHGQPYDINKDQNNIETITYINPSKSEDLPTITYFFYFYDNLLFRTSTYFMYSNNDNRIYGFLFPYFMILIQSDLHIKGEEVTTEENFMGVNYSHENTKLELRYDNQNTKPLFYLNQYIFVNT